MRRAGKTCAEVKWQMVPLGEIKLGRLIHDEFHLPNDATLKFWNMSISAWEKEYHEDTMYWVREGRKQLLGRVISGELVQTVG